MEHTPAFPHLVCVNVVTPDPARLAEFYRTVLGAGVIDTHGGPDRLEIWFGPPGDGTVCLVANRQEGFVHPDYRTCQGFEFRVADVDALAARLIAQGVEVKEPPRDLPWGYRFIHIQDPDGNGIDLVQALE